MLAKCPGPGSMPRKCQRGNQERTYQMTLPGKHNYGSSVGRGDNLLVQGEVEATVRVEQNRL